VYRPGTSGAIFIVFFLSHFFLASCSNAQVLGLSTTEAAERLGKGDISFISSADIPEDFPKAVSTLKHLTKIHPGAPFYAALLSDPPLKNQLFCAALESPSPIVRQEAIKKLIPVVLESEDEARKVLTFLNSARSRVQAEVLRAACLYKTGNYHEVSLFAASSIEVSSSEVSGTDEWERALSLFAELKKAEAKQDSTAAEALAQKIPAFLFEVTSTDVLTWAYPEALDASLLSSAELAVIAAKLVPGNYRLALLLMSEALEDGGSIFFRYPHLIPDLGRAFQYTPERREEGAKLFQSWDRLLSDESDPSGSHVGDPSGSHVGEPGAKFRIIFYSGRIERALGNHERSSELFRRALLLAPDALQSDSCLWYILMNNIAVSPMDAVLAVLETIHLWNDVSYFDDIMDRLSFHLTGRRLWGTLQELFHVLERQGSQGNSFAQYAWILGRAAEEGYLQTGYSAENFFRLAFEADKAGFYYKTMAALKLGASFIPEASAAPAENAARNRTDTGANSGEIDFLLGFFKCGAGNLALPYTREREEKLSIPELRKIAETLASAERWKESLDLVTRYTRRQDHEFSREDLLLLYPQPYRELIEKYAEEAGIGAELLFSLIRTESYFMSSIVSRAGAVGLAQIMAPTAIEMAGRIARRSGVDYRRENGVDLENPEVNIHIGSYYLRYLIEQMGNPMTALLAYNGGMGRIRRFVAADRRLGNIPPGNLPQGSIPRDGLPVDLFLETIEIHETRNYGRLVLSGAAVYGYLYYGKSMEEVASDIYSPGPLR